MKKLATIALLFGGLCVLPAVAQEGSVPAVPEQTAPAPAPTVPKGSYDPRVPARFEISAGYVLRSYSPNTAAVYHLNGAYASFDYNIFWWLGATVEGTASTMKLGNQAAGTAQRLSLLSGLAGPKFYPLHHRTLTPFGQVLLGEGYYRLSAPAFGGFPAKTITATGGTFEFGGGLDLRIKKSWSIRLLEGDYMSSSFYASSLSRSRQTGYRISAGIVYLHGQK